MRGGYCYKPEQRERAPCRARTACWYGSSVGVKRVHRSEKREGGGRRRRIRRGRKSNDGAGGNARYAGPGARKSETERASEPASQPASQTSQPTEPEKGERTSMMNHPPGVSKSEGGRERKAIRGREIRKKRLHHGGTR